MIKREDITILERKASEEKRNGRFKNCIECCLELIELLESSVDTQREIATRWNFVADLHIRLHEYEAAELAARKSLEIYEGFNAFARPSRERDGDEHLATYLMMLGKVLLLRENYLAALPLIEDAAQIFLHVNGSKGSFMEEVIERRDWLRVKAGFQTNSGAV